MAVSYDRHVLVRTLIYHQQVNRPPYIGVCACGWGDRPEHLGASWPEHVVDVYEQAVVHLEGAA